MTERPPAKSTERVRQFRQREADGELLVSLRLSEDETDVLHRGGHLALDAVEDKGAAANAIHELIKAEKQRLDGES
jgi:hypothetical protein